jgi:hypothetical protein
VRFGSHLLEGWARAAPTVAVLRSEQTSQLLVDGGLRAALCGGLIYSPRDQEGELVHGREQHVRERVAELGRDAALGSLFFPDERAAKLAAHLLRRWQAADTERTVAR